MPEDAHQCPPSWTPVSTPAPLQPTERSSVSFQTKVLLIQNCSVCPSAHKAIPNPDSIAPSSTAVSPTFLYLCELQSAQVFFPPLGLDIHLQVSALTFFLPRTQRLPLPHPLLMFTAVLSTRSNLLCTPLATSRTTDGMSLSRSH